jgi:acetyl-CoA carboxylase biotin carboxyl carrier protein
MAGRTRAPRGAPKAAREAPEAAPVSNHAKPGGFALDELKQLIRLVQRTGIGELEVSSGGRTVRIAALPTGVSATVAPAVRETPAPAAAPAPTPAAPRETPAEESRLPAVTSPMVGTFYRAPAPEADPYVEVGSPVDVGQTVCIIEAMKLMNEIESEVKGRIAKILVENAQPVEYGQKLFLIEPA